MNKKEKKDIAIALLIFGVVISFSYFSFLSEPKSRAEIKELYRLKEENFNKCVKYLQDSNLLDSKKYTYTDLENEKIKVKEDSLFVIWYNYNKFDSTENIDFFDSQLLHSDLCSNKLISLIPEKIRIVIIVVSKVNVYGKYTNGEDERVEEDFICFLDVIKRKLFLGGHYKGQTSYSLHYKGNKKVSGESFGRPDVEGIVKNLIEIID